MQASSRSIGLFVASVGFAVQTAAAWATPALGETVPRVSFSDLDGRTRTLPDVRFPSVVIYEDGKAGDQNAKASDFIDRTTDLPANQGKLEAVVIADLAKWNWWPAKKFALAEVKRIAEREKATIHADWTGSVRKSWRLTKGKSGIFVIGVDGKVHFAAEGPLSQTQMAALAEAMKQLGATLPSPPQAGAVAPKHQAVPEEDKVDKAPPPAAAKALSGKGEP